MSAMQRRRIVTLESTAPAPLRLPISARDGGDNFVPADCAQIPSLEALGDRVEPSARRSGGKAAAGAQRRLPLARNRRHHRPGDLGRRRETLEAKRHHVEIARAPDLAARRRQRRDRHPGRFADAMKKEPRDRARFLERLAHIVHSLRRFLAGTGKARRRGADRADERGVAILRPGVGAHR